MIPEELFVIFFLIDIKIKRYIRKKIKIFYDDIFQHCQKKENKNITDDVLGNKPILLI